MGNKTKIRQAMKRFSERIVAARDLTVKRERGEKRMDRLDGTVTFEPTDGETWTFEINGGAKQVHQLEPWQNIAKDSA